MRVDLMCDFCSIAYYCDSSVRSKNKGKESKGQQEQLFPSI
jgi:hypothetical protein